MRQRQDEVLERYMVILACGEQMLASADDNAWDDLIAKQGVYLVEVEQLMELEQHVQLDAEGQELKHDLLTRIRETEHKLSVLLQAQMAYLSDAMEQSRNELRVKQAYGPSAAS